MYGWRKEGKNESVKEEGCDPRHERKGAEKSNIDPRVYLKRVPKSTKIVPKSTQKVPKTKIRQTKNQSNLVKMILDPPGWRFPGYGLVVMELSWIPKSSQIRKKSDAKNRWFFDRSWKRKKWKKIVQNHSKMKPKKSSPEGKTRRKWEKCKNEQHSMVLAWFLPSWGVENQKNVHKNRFENWIKMRCNFEHDFLRIFVDFGGHLGTQDGAKIEEKGYQKQERF